MNNFLLNSETSKKLYEHAKKLPIIDYHNHLSTDDIFSNKRFYNIYDLWIKPDPYKHRAMRMCGVEEKYITGNAPENEKFREWCRIFPNLIGNPLYVWSLSELNTVFEITETPNGNNAELIYQKANMYLKNNIITPEVLFDKFNVELACPCVSICDDVSLFKTKNKVAPSLRGDDAVSPDIEFVHKLESLTCKINNLKDYKISIAKRLDAMQNAGCTFSDHAIDNGFVYYDDDGKNEKRFTEILNGNIPSDEDCKKLFSHILEFLLGEYGARGFTVQLHIGAQRRTSSRLRALAGAAGGYAGIGNSPNIASFTRLIDNTEQKFNKLPNLILFTLNPSDNAMLSALSGSYSADKTPGLITQGPAWWWCDHKSGIEDVLESIASFGLLSNFIGMTTDSRSFLSFVRHDYFRRILCEWLARKYENNELCCSTDDLKTLISKMCCENIRRKVELYNEF